MKTKIKMGRAMKTSSTVLHKSGNDLRQPSSPLIVTNNSALCMNKQVDELVCPITLELPMDPVIAEDGRIYERAAIQQFFKKTKTAKFRSPMTNAEIGSKLYPAIQAKNIIEMIVKSGVVEDKSKMGKWNAKIKNENTIAKMRLKAEGGNLAAMEHLGRWYFKGEKGLKKDTAKAYKWFSEAAEGGHVISMCKTGYLLFFGIGVKAKDEAKGFRLIQSAADQGSDVGAYLVGIAYLKGDRGLPKDIREARKWLTKAVDGNCKYEAENALRKLPHEEMLLFGSDSHTSDNGQNQRKVKTNLGKKVKTRVHKLRNKLIRLFQN